MTPPVSGRPRILALVDYFLPGIKAGGPARTIANLVDHLGDEFHFLIATRDRDLGDQLPYQDLPIGEWFRSRKAEICYLSPRHLSPSRLSRLIRETPHDLLYLNSLFSPRFSVLPLAGRLIRQHGAEPCILAPRGELSPGALALKPHRKRAYTRVGQRLGLFRNLIWQASTEAEAKDIERTFASTSSRILVASDLPTLFPDGAALGRMRQDGEPLRIVTLGRVSPMKNLDYALDVLRQVTIAVEFHAFGPREDQEYWRLCERRAEALPPNIRFVHHGEIPFERVQETLARHDLFMLPTRGENYGHVIAEALQANLPVLISDQTPWRDLDTHGVGWELPLSDPGGFANVIERCFRMDEEARNAQRDLVRRYAERLRVGVDSLVQQNRILFQAALGQV